MIKRVAGVIGITITCLFLMANRCEDGLTQNQIAQCYGNNASCIGDCAGRLAEAHNTYKACLDRCGDIAVASVQECSQLTGDDATRCSLQMQIDLLQCQIDCQIPWSDAQLGYNMCQGSCTSDLQQCLGQ